MENFIYTYIHIYIHIHTLIHVSAYVCIIRLYILYTSSVPCGYGTLMAVTKGHS